MSFLRIREVKPLDGFKLRLGLTDRSMIERDVSDLLVRSRIRKDTKQSRVVRAGSRLGAARWFGRTEVIFARMFSYRAVRRQQKDSNRSIRARPDARGRDARRRGSDSVN